MNDFAIRRAAPADVPVILALMRELAAYEKLSDRFHVTEALIVRDLLGENAAAHCEIAWVDGAAAGLAIWYPVYASFRAQRGLFVEDLYVRPAYRGRGLGRALLAHLARAGEAAGAGWMKWLVLDWNRPAIEFYDTLGARPVEGWLTYALDGDAMKRLGA